MTTVRPEIKQVKSYFASLNISFEDVGDKDPASFKVFKSGTFAYCVTKPICFNKTTETSPPFPSIELKKTSGYVLDASKQFKLINKRHLAPNILVFVSHNSQSDCNSLLAHLAGGKYVGNSFIIDLTKYRTAKAKEETNVIDAYIWFQRDVNDPLNIILSTMDYQQNINRLLGEVL